MRKTTLTIAAIAAAVVIGGGGAAYALTSANTSTPVATPTSSATSTPTDTATASNSPSPTATSTDSDARDNMGQLIQHGDRRYLEAMRRNLPALQSTSDAQLLTLGHETCTDLAKGVPAQSIHVTGVSDARISNYGYNGAFVAAATDNYCPQYTPPKPTLAPIAPVGK